MTPPDWTLIRTFQAVADTGSLSAAARELGLTQPTVGRHIDLLEQALNLTLFTRGRAGMILTEQGADLVQSANDMQDRALAFERRAAGQEATEAGTVRISANEIFGSLLLPGLLAPFLRDNPAIEVEIVVSNAAANLLQRDADIALRMFRPRQGDLIARKVTDLPLGLFGHKDYLDTDGAPETLEDLRRRVFIGFDRETGLIEAAAALGLDLTPHDFRLRSDSILTHLEAIRAGAGIGVTHVGLASKWRAVVPVLPNVKLPPLELWLACHADVRHNPRVRRMMDYLGNVLRRPYARYCG